MTESADFYLEDRLRRSYPDVILTRVFAPNAHHRLINAQFALLGELSELTLIREAGVAMTKMTWWFEEWKRLIGGEPRHPVTRTLARNGAACGVNAWPAIDGALSVVASLVQGDTPSSRDDLQAWLIDVASPLAALEPGVSGAQPRTAATWRQIVLLEWLTRMERLADLGRAPWPLDMAASTQVSRAQLRQAPARTAAARALWDQLTGTGNEDEPAAQADAGAGHGDIYLSVARGTVLKRCLGEAEAGRWRSLLTAWRARRRR